MAARSSQATLLELLFNFDLEGNANGIDLATSGQNSRIDIVLNDIDVSGGTVVVGGEAMGLSAITEGTGAGVSFTMNGGSLEGGWIGGAGSNHGVMLGTNGDNAGVNFTLQSGAITGGTSALGSDSHGVFIATFGENSDISFHMDNGSSIYAAEGNGVRLYAANSSILAGDTINDSIYGGENIAGIGYGTGFHGTADGAGNTDIHVGLLGSVGGAGVGLIGDTLGDGNVTIKIEGSAYQDYSQAFGIDLFPVVIPVAAAGVAYGDGDVRLEATADSTITQIGAIPGLGIEGAGLLGLAYGEGDVTVIADGEVKATGIGAGAFAIGGGDASASSFGTISVHNTNGGNGPLDLFDIDAVGDGTVGLMAASVSGRAHVEFGGTIAPLDGIADQLPDVGLFAIVTDGDKDAQLDIRPHHLTGDPSVVNARLIGAAAVNFGDGAVNITETPFYDPITGTTIYNEVNAEGIGILGLSMSGDVTIQSGTVNTGSTPVLGFSGGVIGASLAGGDVTVTILGDISVDGGMFGAAAFSIGGDATVHVQGNIDPPLFGAWTFTVGGGTSLTEVDSDLIVEADLVGAIAVNLGTGNARVDIGTGALIDSAVTGIATVNIGFGGESSILVREGAAVYGGLVGIDVLHLSPDGPATIENRGLVQGNGVLSPVINAVTLSGLSITNTESGVIRGNLTEAGSPLGPFEQIVSSFGGATLISNAGSMHGNVELIDLSGTGNRIENSAYWETGGFNTLVSGTGNDIIVNTGTIEANFFTFFEVDNIDNAGGNFTTLDFSLDDLTIVTGNFNGGATFEDGSVLAFDTLLTPGGISDLLIVGEDVTGVTYLDVNDLDGGPGQYDPEGVLFAMVGGSTDVTNFTTNGGIDKGLFRYDAYLRDVPVNGLGYDEWVLASTLDREAYEFPVFAYGAQNLWYASAGTWLDRTADLRAAHYGTSEPVVVDLKNEGATVPMPSSVGPGMWGRIYGGHFQRDMSNTSNPPEGLSGPTHVYEDTFRQRHVGIMAGVDGALDGASANEAWLFGLMGGYATSDLDFRESGTEASYRQASVGAYLTYLNGGFFSDLAVKGDFGKMKYSFDDGNFTDQADTKYRSLGVILDTGYRFENGNGWFLEPKATLAYVHTSFDAMDVLGTNVEIENAESLRGRLGARLGGSFVQGGTIVEPYVELSAWHEFQGDNRAILTSNGYNIPVNYDSGGVYGEGVVGASLLNADNGWSVFSKGAVQFGEKGLQGYSGNIGLRKSW